MNQPPVRLTSRLLSYLISFLIAGQPLLPAVAATLTPTGNTAVDQAANGVPVVNIATPNGAGISHNQYQDYNVGKEGLILNNATGKLNQTQLGGLITSNPNLQAGKEAKGIINEVIGGNRSQLQGYTEVAGKAANVMVANPYGITCNGCGFINTPQATLTTGKPVFDANGNLQALDVKKGGITIEGQGLDASNSDALSIISRATTINAAIHAKDLKVIAGANRVGSDGTVQAQQGKGDAPVVAVDTGALGGMYANRIHLVSSENGVGVNLGDLNARQGDITLDANGKLTVHNSLASGSITAKGQSIALTGDHKASGSIALNSQGDLAVSNGSLTSDNDLQLNANGTLSHSAATMTAGRDVVLAAKNISQDAGSSTNAARHISATASDTLTTQGQMTAGQDLSVNAGMLNQNGKLLAGNAAKLNAATLNNSGYLQGNALTVNSTQLNNSGSLLSASDLSLNTHDLSQTGNIGAKGNASITASGVVSNSGALLSDGTLTLAAGDVVQNGTLAGGQGLTINTNTLTSGSSSLTHSGDSLSVTATSATVGGELSAARDLKLKSDRVITAENARLQGGNDLSIDARQAKLAGTQAAKNQLAINASEALDHSGKSSAAQMTVSAQTINNSGTLVASALSLDTASLTNSGLLQGNTIVNLKTDIFTNLANGSLYSAQDLTLDIPTLNNSGLITTDSDLWLKGDSFTNFGEVNGSNQHLDYTNLNNFSDARLLADNQLILKGEAVNNNGLIAASTLQATINALRNEGTIQSDQTLAIISPEVFNSGILRTGGTFELHGQVLQNSGELSATTLLLALSQRINNETIGRLIARESLTLSANEVLNNGLLSASNLQLNSSTLTNGGTIQGTNSLLLGGLTLTNQQAGMILSTGEIDLQSHQISNAGLVQGKILNLATGDWINDGNALGESGLTAKVAGTLTNSGKILSQQTLDVGAVSLDNQGQLLAKILTLYGDLQNSGLLQGSNSLSWSGNIYSNQASGKLISGETLTLSGKEIANKGQIQAAKATINAASLANSGSIQTVNSLELAATDNLDNQGALLSQNLFTLAAEQLFNDGILAGKTLAINAASLTNSGVLQGNSDLRLKTSTLKNVASGQLLSGSGLDLTLDRMENAGLLLVNGDFIVNGNNLINEGDIQADSLNVNLSNSLVNRGNLLVNDKGILNTTTFSNSGSVTAHTLSLYGKEIRNNGLIQGNNAVEAAATRFINEQNGTWLSGGSLTLQGESMTNKGILQGSITGISGNQLDNSGTINGVTSLTGNFSNALMNIGLIQSEETATFSSDTLTNTGRMMGSILSLNARELDNSGLWQGTSSLTATGDILATSEASRVLSGGLLSLNARELTTKGTLQGQGVAIDTIEWSHDGSLLSQDTLRVNASGTITSSGSLMSQGDADIASLKLDNNGQILGEQAILLSGGTLENSGTVQANTLKLQHDAIDNQGTLTGLQSLTLQAQQQLLARMAMAEPQLKLTIGGNGKLLTQGKLTVNATEVNNAGSWQAEKVLLNAKSLIHSGAIQSADALQVILSDNLTTTAGSKIASQGIAALQATNLSNQGQWVAKNLTLNGNTLSNSGTISGVASLLLGLTGTLSQLDNGAMLTGGALNLNATSVTNDGKIQGGLLNLTTGTLTNNGRLQGDNGGTLTLNGALTNNAKGEIVSQQKMAITTPVLFNYGLIQSGSDASINASTLARNDGKLLSATTLALSTPQFNGAGWLQASNLILNAATASNDTGTWIAERATLSGDTLTNRGSTQAGTLDVNYKQLTNDGTLLGNTQLTISADQVTQSVGAKLLSGGDLWLGSKSLDVVGQLVSLGNLTLQLTNAFTNRTAIAAGKNLTIISGGDIDNRNVIQGQAINLSAGGLLSNNGKITIGNSASTLSGNNVALNSNGSLQGGADITITSRDSISIDGFTGTRGSLTLIAPGSIVNTALLYAANNLALFANSITNYRGDIMAGNNLWLQKDAAGNANSQIVNTSGNIETQNGDIQIKTGHLINQWLSISVGETVKEDIKNNLPEFAWSDPGTVNIPINYFSPDELTYVNISKPIDFGMQEEKVQPYSYALLVNPSLVKEFAVSRITYSTVATGSAGRITAGRDMNGTIGTLDNLASFMLAGRNISLSGGTLNNQSWQSGTQTVYQRFTPDSSYATNTFDPKYIALMGMTFTATPVYNIPDIVNYLVYHPTEEYRTELSSSLRAVLQGNGNVALSFGNIANNSDSTDVRGTIYPSLTAPGLQTPDSPSAFALTKAIDLLNFEKTSGLDSEWQDHLQESLKRLNGSIALDTSGATNEALGNISALEKDDANLGTYKDLIATGVTTTELNSSKASANGQIQGRGIDTNAYPLPSGNNGYFVFSDDPKSPYLINVNPKLNSLGQLDPALFADLNAMLGIKPLPNAPQETRTAFTDEKQFLGSAYLLDRLNLNPDYDYRFLGDATFDTRYVSNVVLSQTGNRYLNGIGSDLDQMRYLLDNAAEAQQSLGLQLGISLTAEQIAALEHSILWWEKTTINGETVMVPKVYLSPKDVTVSNGSVIAGNNVSLQTKDVNNSGSTILANNNLTLDSQNSISNLNSALLKAGGDLNLQAVGDINNIGSTISGKTVALESTQGNINSLTLSEQINKTLTDKYGRLNFIHTELGNLASISAQDSVQLASGKNINLSAANVEAGGDILLNAWGNISVNANQINNSLTASQSTVGSATVSSQGSHLSASGNLIASAANNIDINASALNSGKSLALNAGNNLNLNAEATNSHIQFGTQEWHSTGTDRTTLTAGDNVAMVAGRDITSHAAGIVAENNVGMQAGRDVNLLAEATAEGDSIRSKNKTVINESVRQQSTEIASGGDTKIIAGRDVNAQATQVTAQGDIGVAAGRDVNLTTATESDYAYREEKKSSSGFLSKKSTHTISEDSATREAGTLLSGDNVQVVAGNNLLVKGSSVVGDDAVKLSAGNNVDIVAATNTDTSWRFKEEKKSGLMGTGGIGITIGSSKTTHNLREAGTTQSQSFSTVGSTGGSVDISAGNLAHIGGADLIAGKDLSLSGSSVLIEPGHDKRSRDETFEQKKSGLTLALSGTVGSAINNAVTNAQETQETSDSRLKALQATKTALSGVQAGQAAAVASATGDPNAMGVSLSLTTQKSKSQQHAESDAVAGSTLNAGNNLSITANGKKDNGDIVIAGSQLKAGGDTLLDAKNDVILSGAANTQQSSGKNSSSGGGVGISIGAGGGGAGISVFANVNAAHGKDKGNGTDWTETTIDSGKTLTINSGHDTVLNGAQVSADTIIADVGHDLLMSSQQDSNKYDSKQTSVAAGGSFTFGSMTGSGYISASQDKMKSRFDSVAEQTGMFAGNGGFDITVGNHTQLDGAVIASTASADKNSLDTGTLGFSDLHNEADFKTQHSGISLSGGGSFGGNFEGNMPGGMISAAGNKGHAEGTTQSAIADGTITIRDKDNQKQDVADLSRDTEHANDSISPIFDKEKEQNRLKEIGLISDIGSQAADIARTQGDLNALNKAKKDSGITLKENATEKERQDYIAALRNSPEYKSEMAQYGTGSLLQRGIQAATAALQGLAGGNIAGALAGASAPELANLIGHKAGVNDNDTAKAIAHAILGGVTAALQGNNAAAGAIGAASGELAAKTIAGLLYPSVSDLSKLTEEQRQTVSSLASISAGMAGGLAGGNTAGAATGASAGKNAAENNFLGATSSEKLVQAINKIKQGDKSPEAANALIKLENADKRSDALMDKFRRDPSSLSDSERVELNTYVRVYAAEMQSVHGMEQGMEMVKNLFAYPGYERNPDSEALNQAQGIVNTWGYHESNASIGNAPLSVLGGSVLGNTIKESMIANATIGTAINTGVQLNGPDPFSFVDAIMAGITSAATTGQGWRASAAINMGGAAIGSAIKGEDPINSSLGAGFGSVIGDIGGTITKGGVSLVTKDSVSDLIGSAAGSYISEKSGNFAEHLLDEKEKANDKK